MSLQMGGGCKIKRAAERKVCILSENMCWTGKGRPRYSILSTLPRASEEILGERQAL